MAEGTTSLEQLRKQAKDLLRSQRLRAYVGRVAANGPELQHAYHEDFDYYEGRAYGLRASAEDGTEGAVAAFRRWEHR